VNYTNWPTRDSSQPEKTNEESIDECGVLFKAAKDGNIPTIKQVLDKDPKRVNDICTACRSISLVVAAAVSGQQKAVKEVCNRGTNVEIRDVESYTIIKLTFLPNILPTCSSRTRACPRAQSG
jgi:hypothetical protein